MKRLLGALVVAALAPTALAGPAHADAPERVAAAHRGQLTVVQALPGQKVAVSIDGRTVRRRAAVGTVIGPFQLAAGRHRVRFDDVDGRRITTAVTVAAGSNSDVVLHQPASVDGAPVVNTYAAPMGAIGPGKSRLLLAHTATVAPADVAFDGKVVFDNIANGEYAQADVPAGRHKVALYPTGRTTGALIGPLKISLAPRTATMIYAFGDPTDGSMNVVSHTAALEADGTVVPKSIHTGAAGLVGDRAVRGFGKPASVVSGAGAAASSVTASSVPVPAASASTRLVSSPSWWWLLTLTLALVLVRGKMSPRGQPASARHADLQLRGRHATRS